MLISNSLGLNWDLAMQKYRHFTESMRLQFRAEMFKFLQAHTQLYAPNQFMGSGAFWQDQRSFPGERRTVRHEVLLVS
jgi:hypothetical protein